MTEPASKENLLAALGHLSARCTTLEAELTEARKHRNTMIVTLRGHNVSIRDLAYYSGLTTRRVTVLLQNAAHEA